MGKKYHFISIIIPNYNGSRIIDECIRHIKLQNYRNYEIILVDDNSTDDSLAKLKKFTDIKIVKNHKNLGFSGSCCVGAENSQGEILLFLNTDSFLIDRETLSEVNTRFINTPSLNILGFSQINKDGTSQFKGSEIDLFFNINSFNLSSVKKYTMVGGACFATLKSNYDLIGGIDCEYFLYSEEVDYMYRSLKCGYKTEVSDLEVIHLGGESTKNEYNASTNKTKIFYRERNSLITMVKNYDVITIFLILPLWIVFYILELLFLVLTFKLDYVQTYFKVIDSFIKKLKFSLRKRSENFKIFKKSDIELLLAGYIKINNFKILYLIENGLPKLK